MKQQQKPKNLKVAYLLVIVMIILALIGVNYLIGKSKTKYSPNQLTNLLNEKNVTYYYSPDCSHCESEKRFLNFSGIERKINVLESGYYSNFDGETILGTPAFEHKGEIKYGEMNDKQLYAYLSNLK